MDSGQLQEVEYMSGVTAQGTVARTSFWTWNGDQPASYSNTSVAAKWSASSAGTGATVTVSFDASSNWTSTEKAAFMAGLHLWSEVANVRFNVVTGSADIVFNRSHDGKADTSSGHDGTGPIGSTQVGALGHATIAIDTSAAGFGPVGAPFDTYGGYPWQTLEHEIGHAIGLGHSGAYDDGETTAAPMLTAYDNTAWSLMSYNAVGQNPNIQGFHSFGNAPDGSLRVPITPMALDIAAAQRLYGVATDTPLSGGQTFGFHSNIQGDTAQFFDFNINRTPVVTIWDSGGGNTLDLSGYSSSNNVDLHEGAFSSVGTLLNNLAIAFGTRIDTVIGGANVDYLQANDNGDVIIGGAEADTLKGGVGNDHLYGNVARGAAGQADGADHISTGDGTNYVNGNAGDDIVTVDGAANRIYGGAGNDTIDVDSGVNHINGNTGNDHIAVYAGENDIRGGQGDDFLGAYGGNSVQHGDIGNDSLESGPGVDLMTGGDGQDRFSFGHGGASPVVRTGDLAGYHDEITDFTHGSDVIYIAGNFDDPRDVLHGPTFGSFDDAASYARSLIAGDHYAVAALGVGSDTYLFWDDFGYSGNVDTAIKLDGVDATQMQGADFSW